MKWRAAGSDFLGPRGMARSARGRKSRTDVAGTRSRARKAGSAFGQTSLYRGRDGCARRENTWNEDRRPLSVRPFGSKATGVAAKRKLTLTRPPRWRVISRIGDRRCQQSRRTCRSCHRKIDYEAGGVPAMWMQPRPPHPCNRPPCERETDAKFSVAGHAGHRVRAIAPSRAMERSWASGCNSVGEGCEHNRPLQQSGCRARFRLERYFAGGRSGLSAHFRAAGSRSASRPPLFASLLRVAVPLDNVEMRGRRLQIGGTKLVQ